MANVKIIETSTILELDPGKKTHRHWNNASPENAVWSVNAVPVGASGQPQDVSLEVTRLWRRLIVTVQTPGSPGSTASESEIHYEIKNIGTQKARFKVYLAAIS